MQNPESHHDFTLTDRRLAAPSRRNFVIVAAAILLPFAIVNTIDGIYPVAIATGLLCILLVLIAINLHKGGELAWLGTGVMLFGVMAVYLSVYFQGLIGIFWSYPVVLLFHFNFKQRTALILNTVYISGLMPLAILAIGWEQGARVFFTLLLTSAFAIFFSRRLFQQQSGLRRLALVDHLTGAFNRRHLDDCMTAAVEMKRRYGNNASLLIIDVDHFKEINDSYGHKVGDDVLIRLVKTVQKRIRKTDQLFRLGGDEFVLLLPSTDVHWAGSLAQDVRQLVTTLGEQMKVHLSVSSGVAELCQGEDMESWLHRSDKALYEAKQSGRNTVSTSHSHVLVG